MFPLLFALDLRVGRFLFRARSSRRTADDDRRSPERVLGLAAPVRGAAGRHCEKIVCRVVVGGLLGGVLADGFPNLLQEFEQFCPFPRLLRQPPEVQAVMVGPFGLVDDIEELSSIPSFEQENGVERFSVAEIAGVHAGQAIRDPHAVPEQVHPEPAARRSHEDPRSHLPRCGLYRDAGSVHYGAPRAVRMLARGPQPCVERRLPRAHNSGQPALGEQPRSQIGQITNKNGVYWVLGVQINADLSRNDPRGAGSAGSTAGSTRTVCKMRTCLSSRLNNGYRRSAGSRKSYRPAGG